MDAELRGPGEFSELVSDHLFCHVDRKEFLSIVDSECKPNELWWNVAVASPRLDDLLFRFCDHRVDLPEQALIDVGAFLEGTRHKWVGRGVGFGGGGRR